MPSVIRLNNCLVVPLRSFDDSITRLLAVISQRLFISGNALYGRPILGGVGLIKLPSARMAEDGQS